MADRAGKVARLASELACRPALLVRLVSEGMALLWGAVAAEPVAKVSRRALKALGLLHALSTGLPAPSLSTPTPSPDQLGMLGADSSTSSTGGIGVGRGGVMGTPQPGVQHPDDCLCCVPGAGTDPRVALEQALRHVSLVRRLLGGCRELEARCEALRCLGRALGSAVRACEGVAAGDGGGGGALGVAAASRPLAEALSALVGQVAEAAAPWQPEDWRLAGAEALAACGLMQAAEAADRGRAAAGAEEMLVLSLRGWRCVIALLEVGAWVEELCWWWLGVTCGGCWCFRRERQEKPWEPTQCPSMPERVCSHCVVPTALHVCTSSRASLPHGCTWAVR